MRNPLPALWLLPRTLLTGAITLYQRTLSPDHGPLRHLWRYGYCRHEPTCSEYGKRIIAERGAMIGVLLATKRLLTCHPWRSPSPEKIMRASHGEQGNNKNININMTIKKGVMLTVMEPIFHFLKRMILVLKDYQTVIIGLPTVLLLIWTLSQNKNLFKLQTKPILVPDIGQQEIYIGDLVKTEGFRGCPYVFIPIKNIGKGPAFNLIINSKSENEEINPFDTGDQKGSSFLETNMGTGISIIYPKDFPIKTIQDRFMQTRSWHWVQYSNEYGEKFSLKITLIPNTKTNSLSVYFEYE